MWKLTYKKIENKQSDHPAGSILPSAKNWNVRNDVSHIPGWDFSGRNAYTGQGIKNLQSTSRVLLHAWERWLILTQEIHAMHSVILGLSEVNGEGDDCAGHWPGWYTGLAQHPGSYWEARKMNYGLENQTPMEPLNKFHLNIYPGESCKLNWSQPMGKKKLLGENTCSTGLCHLRRANAEWHQPIGWETFFWGEGAYLLYTSVSFFTGGHISSGLSKPLRPKGFKLAVKEKAPDNIPIIHNLEKVSISFQHHLQTHHGTVVSQWLCDPPPGMSHPGTSCCGAGTNMTGEEEPAVVLVFSFWGFSPNPAKHCTLWSVSRCVHSQALMHVNTHKGVHFPWTLFWKSPIPSPLSIFSDLQTC